MENIKFEITEEDIKKYLFEHKGSYKFSEALFLKYLKENRITKESLQMLIDKYNHTFIDKEDINIYSNYFNKISCFDSKLCVYENLDLSGICHILIPTIRYYGKKDIHFNYLYTNLDVVSAKLSVPMDKPVEVIESTLDDYRICEKVVTDGDIISITMSRKQCQGELLVYQDYFLDDKVKKIRKTVRERII